MRRAAARWVKPRDMIALSMIGSLNGAGPFCTKNSAYPISRYVQTGLPFRADSFVRSPGVYSV